MRFKTFLVFALVTFAMSVWQSPTARAQSIFQSLFGYSTPKQSSRAPITRRPTRQLYRSTNPKNRPLLFGPRRGQGFRSHRRAYGIGSYRTVCVRTCDGYYFPISSQTSRSRFHKDARTCSNRCGSSAQLFYLPRQSQNIKGARSLSGRTYADLENAFKYRKTLVSGCACKPMPWSAAARARHRRYEYVKAVQDSYAKAEARAKARAKEHAKKVAERAAKARAKAFAAEQAAIERARKLFDTASAMKVPSVMLFQTTDFHDRWRTVSTRFAAPMPETTFLMTSNGIQETTHDGQPVDPANGGRDVFMTPETVTDGNGSTSAHDNLAPNSANNNRKTRPRPRKTKATRSKRTTRKKKPAVAFSGLFGPQKSKYRWPGD